MVWCGMYETYRQNCSTHRVHLSVANTQVKHQLHAFDCQSYLRERMKVMEKNLIKWNDF